MHNYSMDDPLWHRIESAPKRGKVLIYRSDGGGRIEIAQCQAFYKFIGNPDLAYTHWMELPDPPKRELKAGPMLTKAQIGEQMTILIDKLLASEKRIANS